MEVKVKILAKKGDNKAFKASDENWYNLNASVVPYLEKMNKGDEIVVTYEKKGVSRYVSKIVKATDSTSKPEPQVETESSTGFACAVCGKEMKNDKFKVCYVCNKKGLKPKVEKDEAPRTEKKNYYDNPEKTAQIQRGNAGNMAASVASGQNFSDPETAAEFTLLLADRFLEWLRAE